MNQAAPKQNPIPFWHTKLGEAEGDAARSAILAGHLSQGAVTETFEKKLAELFGVPYAVTTTSGSAALFMAVRAAGIGAGDEVILPNRTFVATAHAVLLAGAKVKLIDTLPDRPVMDASLIESAITSRTKAVLPVHLNGRGADMPAITALAKKRGLLVIEDAAQAFHSRSASGFLGAQSDLGCFSLGVTKLVTTGQGGFVLTRRKELHDRMQLLKNHGVVSTFAASYDHFGFNLKYNDIAAAVGLVQLGRIPAKEKAHRAFYAYYKAGLANLKNVVLLPVDEKSGELPLWVEALCPKRDRLIELLEKEGIQARPFLPDLDLSPHLENPDHAQFVNCRKFAAQGLFLPCGPDMPEEWMKRTLEILAKLDAQVG